jgi:hypothetical protein
MLVASVNILYNFQGVVIGWAYKPIVDESQWDGVQHLITEGNIHPNHIQFYHKIPETIYCI